MSQTQGEYTLFRKRHPVLFWGYVLIEAPLVVLCLLYSLRDNLFVALITFFIFQIPFALPAGLTFTNVYFLFYKPKDDPQWGLKLRAFETPSFLLGLVFTIFYCALINIRRVDWQIPVASWGIHSPIALADIPTAQTLFVLGVIGYLLLICTKTKKTPPLVTATGVSLLIIGILECLLWSIQTFSVSFVLVILPLNSIVIAIRLIRDKTLEIKNDKDREGKAGLTGWLYSTKLPIYSFLLSVFVLILTIAVLVLFGQRPNAIIQGYLDTADWSLSQKVAPELPPPALENFD